MTVPDPYARILATAARRAEILPEAVEVIRLGENAILRARPGIVVRIVRPGGLLAMPWAPNEANGHKLVLTATGDGTAVGRLRGQAGFMPLRSQRFVTPNPEGDDRELTPRIDSRRLTADPGFPAALVGLLPAVSFMAIDHEGDHIVIVRGTDSYAAAERPHTRPGTGAATQSGPRNLWAEVEAAYLTWVGLSCSGAVRPHRHP